MRSTPDLREWVRKHDDRRDGPYLPEGKLRRHWYPSTADEVVDIVREVAVTEPKPFVRAAGSGWALSEAVCDPLFEYDLVETHGLNTVRTDVVPHCLSREVRSALAPVRLGANAFRRSPGYGCTRAALRDFRTDKGERPAPVDSRRRPRDG
jgi:hypothetical protein